MTKTELYTALSKVCATFYGRANVGTELPYMTFTWDHMPNFAADDVVYQRAAVVTIYLYAVDPDTEEAVNDALDELGVYWTSTSSFEVSDGAYLTIYTMEVIEDGKD